MVVRCIVLDGWICMIVEFCLCFLVGYAIALHEMEAG